MPNLIDKNTIFDITLQGQAVLSESTIKEIFQAFLAQHQMAYTSFAPSQIVDVKLGHPYDNTYTIKFKAPLHVINPNEINTPFVQHILKQLDPQAYTNWDVHTFRDKQGQKINVCFTHPIAFYHRQSRKLQEGFSLLNPFKWLKNLFFPEPKHRHVVGNEIVGKTGYGPTYHGRRLVNNYGNVYKSLIFREGKSKDLAIKTTQFTPGSPLLDDPQRELNFKQKIHYLRGKGLVNVGNDIFFNVSRYFEGQDILHYLNQRGNNAADIIDFKIALNIMHHVKKIHAAGVVHRDLKPKNIVYDPNKEKVKAYPIDLGISKEIHENLGIDEMTGTGKYLSPEAKEKPHPTTSDKSDVFAMGVIIDDLLQPKGENNFDTYTRPRLNQLIKKMKKDKPAERITLDDAYTELAAILRDMPKQLENKLNDTNRTLIEPKITELKNIIDKYNTAGLTDDPAKINARHTHIMCQSKQVQFMLGISDYLAKNKPGVFGSLFFDTNNPTLGQKRADTYFNLLANAKDHFEAAIIMYALLASTDGETLQKHVREQAGMNAKEELKGYLNYFLSLLTNDKKDLVDGYIKSIVYYVNTEQHIHLEDKSVTSLLPATKKPQQSKPLLGVVQQIRDLSPYKVQVKNDTNFALPLEEQPNYRLE